MNFFKGLIAVFMSMSIYSNCAGAQGVAPDENLKTMRLPNGLTVAVYENYEPPKRCSMRLLVKSGSLFETESERGLAHFIEHMAFNGTKHFPSGEMTEYFQRLGMAFGSDFVISDIRAVAGGVTAYTDAGYVTRLHGDANSDGRIDITDLVRTKKIISGCAADRGDGADCNSDGNVNADDLSLLRKYLIVADGAFD